MKKIVVLIFLMSSFASALFSWGRCPNVKLQQGFSILGYLGEWYELVRNKDMPFEKGDCNKARYTLGSSGFVEVFNSEVFEGVKRNATGYAYCEKKEPAQCYAKFSAMAPAGDYEVVSTDYNQYAVVFSCFSVGFAHWKLAWVLSRTKEIDYRRFLPEIEALGIPESALYFASHSNCPDS